MVYLSVYPSTLRRLKHQACSRIGLFKVSLIVVLLYTKKVSTTRENVLLFFTLLLKHVVKNMRIKLQKCTMYH